MLHIVDMVSRNLLGKDSFTGVVVGFGHHGSAFPSIPFLHHACAEGTVPPSCWLQHSVCSEPFQTINPAEKYSLFSIARFTVLRDGKRLEVSFKASSTTPTVPSHPY